MEHTAFCDVYSVSSSVARLLKGWRKMEVDRNGVNELVRRGLGFMLRLTLVLGGLGFASVFAVALLVGGIYLIAAGHPSGGYALAGASVLVGVAVLTLVLVVTVRFVKEKTKDE